MDLQSNVEVVVAHYNEDLSWLEGHTSDCTIYHKGGEKHAPPYPHLTLPNIGREGHTYLHHITERYDSLADVTVFLQGRIDDHVTISLDEIIDRASKTKDGQVVTFPFRELELFNLWNGMPWEEYPCWKKWSSMPVAEAPKTPAQYWQQLFPGTKVPASIGFQPGAMFAVRRSTIQQYPLNFYKSLFEEFFQGNMAHVNPGTGHYMERFWLAMWNPSEYICWHDGDVSSERRNGQGQLAKGLWHVTPKFVEVDECTLPPMITQLPTPPSEVA
ncbi:hypothetical protein P7C71_g4524, partial [Lecanoromycetidae sp. Uapishka_2]